MKNHESKKKGGVCKSKSFLILFASASHLGDWNQTGSGIEAPAQCNQSAIKATHASFSSPMADATP